MISEMTIIEHRYPFMMMPYYNLGSPATRF
jgi:hypothetical protein